MLFEIIIFLLSVNLFRGEYVADKGRISHWQESEIKETLKNLENGFANYVLDSQTENTKENSEFYAAATQEAIKISGNYSVSGHQKYVLVQTHSQSHIFSTEDYFAGNQQDGLKQDNFSKINDLRKQPKASDVSINYYESGSDSFTETNQLESILTISQEKKDESELVNDKSEERNHMPPSSLDITTEQTETVSYSIATSKEKVSSINNKPAEVQNHESLSDDDLAGKNFLPKSKFFGLNLLKGSSKERQNDSSIEINTENKDVRRQYFSPETKNYNANHQDNNIFSREFPKQGDYISNGRKNQQGNILFEEHTSRYNHRKENWHYSTLLQENLYFTAPDTGKMQDNILFTNHKDGKRQQLNSVSNYQYENSKRYNTPTGSNVMFSGGHTESNREDNVFFKDSTTEPLRKKKLTYDHFYKRKNSLFYNEKDAETLEREQSVESYPWKSTTLNRFDSTTENSVWSYIYTTEGHRPKNSNSQSKRSLVPQEKCGLDIPRRIIGGLNTDIDEFPWLCRLQYIDPSGKVSHDCSGALISRRYVLTAAHCTHGLGVTSKNMKVRKVQLGEWDSSTDKDCQGDVCSPPVQEIQVEDIIPHEKYKPKSKTQDNDVALIRLRDEATLNQFVQPICLPFDEIGNSDYENKKLTVSGWGRTSNAKDSASSIKKKIDLPVVNQDRCRQFYQSFYGDVKISQNQFCAGGEEGQDSCQGDSGGPLMTTARTSNEFKWYVIGIVSSGPAACGVKDRPSLYTNVSRYIDWILDNIKN